jgi:hypothetical protein
LKLTGQSLDGTSWARTGQSKRRRFSTAKQSSGQLSTSLSAKVYLRNSGKGILEFADGYLRFYVETGRFAKKKEIAKEIPLKEVENISLEDKELNLDWKESTQRFVFENNKQAKTIFESVHDFLNQVKTQKGETVQAPEPSSQPPQVTVPEAEPPQEPKITSQTPENKPRSKRRPQVREKAPDKVPKPPAQTTKDIIMEPEVIVRQTEVATPKAETPIQPEVPASTKVPALGVEPPAKEITMPPPVPPKEEQDAASVIASVYPLVDQLFDILSNLHGKVDWISMENSVEKINGESRLIEKAMGCSNLDVSPLAEAAKQWNTSGASKEVYQILVSLDEAFSELTSKNANSPQMRQQYEIAKAILHSYYVLNDIVLAFVVGDPTVEEETALLGTLLDGLVKTTTFQLDAKAVVGALGKVQVETGSQQSVVECRALFKKQVEPLLLTAKSSQ